MWRQCRELFSRKNQSGPHNEWEYKVVQLVGHKPADPTDASRKLGGSLSPETLRNQFPEHYSSGDGRKQINDFLNLLGNEGWELVQFQQVGELPLMILKRLKIDQSKSTLQPEVSTPATN
jgi:hypothetical protein